jgi:hypothetical protein
VRIEDYALLGDLETAALVGRDGSVDWLCLPRFDSGACFAALLGDHGHGRWRLAPGAGGPAVRRRYRPGTLILEQEWDTPEATVRVTDAMPPHDEAANLVHVVEGLSGRVPMRMDLAIRLDYGAAVPWVTRTADGLSAMAGPDALRLRTPADIHGEGMSTVAEFAAEAGDRVPFTLDWHPSHRPAPEPVLAFHALGLRRDARPRLARRLLAAPGPAHRLQAAGRDDRVPRGGCAPARQGDLGGAWPAPSLVHSQVMAWVAFDRAVKYRRQRRARGPTRALAAHPRRAAQRDLLAGLRRRAQHVHAVLRLARARRLAADHPHHRLPAPR